MKYYYKHPIDTQLFKEIKKELTKSNDWKSIDKMAWIPPEGWLECECPISYKWIETVREREIQFIRFHLTPPQGKLNLSLIHI